MRRYRCMGLFGCGRAIWARTDRHAVALYHRHIGRNCQGHPDPEWLFWQRNQ